MRDMRWQAWNYPTYPGPSLSLSRPVSMGSQFSQSRGYPFSLWWIKAALQTRSATATRFLSMTDIVKLRHDLCISSFLFTYFSAIFMNAVLRCRFGNCPWKFQICDLDMRISLVNYSTIVFSVLTVPDNCVCCKINHVCVCMSRRSGPWMCVCKGKKTERTI